MSFKNCFITKLPEVDDEIGRQGDDATFCRKFYKTFFFVTQRKLNFVPGLAFPALPSIWR